MYDLENWKTKFPTRKSGEDI